MAKEKRLIDANAVLAEQFTAGLSDASGNYHGYADIVFVDDIENAPIVDAVEVVHASWEPVKGLFGFNTWEVQCSECKAPQDLKSNYCPNCGAKMDLEG